MGGRIGRKTRVQARYDDGAGPRVSAGKRSLVQARYGFGGGRSLPDGVRDKMEASFQTDFSGVNLHVDDAPTRMGALAFANGDDIHIAPGAYAPESASGQELIGHELAHVVQQRQGRVSGPQGKDAPVVDDPALEREADQAGARAARGQPAGLGPAGTAPAGARIQAKQNELHSMNGINLDAREGYLTRQEDLVQDFVADVDRMLASWANQRQTPDLRFALGEQMDNRWRQFRDATVKDPYGIYASHAAERMIGLGKNKQYIREIRMFAPDLLNDYARALDIETGPPAHRYEIKAIADSTASGGMYGGKIGTAARRIQVRYTNDAIPGLTWTQEVALDGIILGFGLSVGNLKKWMKDKGGDPGSAGISQNAPALAGWVAPRTQPHRYLSPSWFDGAEYTRPSAEASLSGGAGKAGPSSSALLLRNTDDGVTADLLFEMSGVSVSQGVTQSRGGDPGGSRTGADAGASAQTEFGDASLAGELDFEAGEWGEVEDIVDPRRDMWVPLHFARLYFPTEGDQLGPEDFATLDQLVAAIIERDHMDGYQGTKFKVEVSGCHSQAWNQYDDQLAALERKRESGQLSQRQYERRRDEIESKKHYANEDLAYMRASNALGELEQRLGTIKSRVWANLIETADFEAPSTHEPIGLDPAEDLADDRSVTITVSYQLYSPNGQLPYPGPVRY